jgi:hypothetical protein
MSNVNFITLSDSLLPSSEIRPWDKLSIKRLQRFKNPFLIFSPYSALLKAKEELRELKELEKELFKGLVLSVDPDIYTISGPYLKEDLTDSIKKKIVEVSDIHIIKRIYQAWKLGAQEDLIADFNIDSHGNLFLRSCDFKVYSCHAGLFNSLKDMTKKERENFTLDNDGSYIHWPTGDIHLDLDSFKIKLDENYKKKVLKENLKFQKDLGAKLKNLRLSKGLLQKDFTLSPKTISRYEHGEEIPTYKALEKIAKAYKMDIDELMATLSEVLI